MNRLLLSSVIVLSLCSAAAAQGGDLSGRVIAKMSGGAAIVWIEGLSGGAVPEQDTVITHLPGGRFEPAVNVGFVGNEFVFRNQDDTLHTTHLYLHLAGQEKVSGRPLVNGATLYNIALPRTGMKVERPILAYHEFRDETGPIEVKCNLHPNEIAHLLVFGHPFAAVTNEQGRFTIKDVPAGEHEVWVWHADTVSRWGTVEISEGGAEKVIEIGEAK